MTIMAPEPDTPAAAWELIPLGRGGWRICDGSRAQTDASRLIAYVEKSEVGTLDVLWLRSPCPTRSRYRNFDELLADLDSAIEGASSSRSSPPRAIRHHPPGAKR